MQFPAKLYQDKTTFVYRPGGAVTGNFYDDWTKLMAQVAVSSGPRTIFFDDTFVSPAVIPAGAYALEEVSFANAKFGTPTAVQVANGVTWTGLRNIKNLTLQFLNTALVESLPNNGMLIEDAIIIMSGTSPVWEVPAGAEFHVESGAFLSGSGLAAVINIPTGQTLNLVVAGASQVNSLAISSPPADPTAVLNVQRPDESGGFQVQAAQFGGTYNDVPQQNAENLFYSPAVPANWPVPPNDVAEALDEIASSGLTTATPLNIPNTIVKRDGVTGGFQAGIIKLLLDTIQFGTTDPFARNQIWDYMVNSVLRLGAWQADGDATSQSSEGIVVYGDSLLGVGINPADGSYARVKNNRFGLFDIDSGLPFYAGGAYYYRVDDTQIIYRDNAGVTSISIDRATGNVQVKGTINYTPAVPANWPVVPTTIQGALDELAANSPTITNNFLNSAAVFSTSSATDVVITGFTVTPTSGTYMVWVAGEWSDTAASAILQVSLYKDGVQVADSLRNQRAFGTNDKGIMSTASRISVNGAQAIDVRINTNSGTVSAGNRSLLLVRVGS